MQSNCLIKILYAVYLFIATIIVSDDILIFSLVSPVYIIVLCVSFDCIIQAEKRNEILFIVGDGIYIVSLFLCISVNSYFILLSLICIVIDICSIIKKDISVKCTTKWAILLNLWQMLFLAMSFSVYYKSFELWLYMIFVVLAICGFIPQLILIVRTLGIKKDSFGNIFSIALFYVCLICWHVPVFFSILLYDSGMTMSLEYMIYGMLIAIYPYSKILIEINKQKENNAKENEINE